MGEKAGERENWPLLPRRLGRSGFYFVEVVTTLHAGVAGVCLKAFGSVYPAIWWPIAAILLTFWVQLNGKRFTEAERIAKEAAEAERREAVERAKISDQKALKAELDALAKNKEMMAGNLAIMLRALHNGTNHCRELQSSFLHHAVDVVKDALRIERRDQRISATWVVPTTDYAQWGTVAYDRNLVGRAAGQMRPISAGIPGAAEAFLTGNDVYVKDTTDKSVAKHFGTGPKYRTIVSVPARMLNVTRAPNVHINGGANVIIGVLNVDATEADILPAEAADYVRDIAFLIGLLEYLNNEMGGAHVGDAEKGSVRRFSPKV